MLTFKPNLKNHYVVDVTYNDFNIGEIYCESDGFYVFEPIAGRGGYWSDWMLRDILEYLDSLNASHELELQLYFDIQESINAESEQILHANTHNLFES